MTDKTTLLTSDILAAIATAKARDEDWQAELLEIALIPAVTAAWRAANRGRLLNVTRIDGIPHKGFARDDNLARCQAKTWGEVSGYTLDYGVEGMVWNSVRPGHYGHSAGVAWDGVRRESRCGFIEDIRNAVRPVKSHLRQTTFAEYRRNLAEYGLDLVDDAGVEVQA